MPLKNVQIQSNCILNGKYEIQQITLHKINYVTMTCILMSIDCFGNIHTFEINFNNDIINNYYKNNENSNDSNDSNDNNNNDDTLLQPPQSKKRKIDASNDKNNNNDSNFCEFKQINQLSMGYDRTSPFSTHSILSSIFSLSQDNTPNLNNSNRTIVYGWHAIDFLNCDNENNNNNAQNHQFVAISNQNSILQFGNGNLWTRTVFLWFVESASFRFFFCFFLFVLIFLFFFLFCAISQLLGCFTNTLRTHIMCDKPHIIPLTNKNNLLWLYFFDFVSQNPQSVHYYKHPQNDTPLALVCEGDVLSVWDERNPSCVQRIEVLSFFITFRGVYVCVVCVCLCFFVCFSFTLLF